MLGYLFGQERLHGIIRAPHQAVLLTAQQWSVAFLQNNSNCELLMCRMKLLRRRRSPQHEK
jgi:hypothetical protein